MPQVAGQERHTGRRRLSTSGLVDGAGVVEVISEQVPQGYAWLIERIIVHTTSTVASAFGLYADQATVDRMLEYTNAGNFAVADEASPILVEEGSRVIARWENCSLVDAGGLTTAATIVLQYRLEAV
jgi:hypothetical protein